MEPRTVLSALRRGETLDPDAVRWFGRAV